jgi:hypothetical protein
VSKPRNGEDARRTPTRAEAAADALGSVRAEGLDPGRAEPLLQAWSRGELTDAQLNELSIRMLHDRLVSAEELLATVSAA